MEVQGPVSQTIQDGSSRNTEMLFRCHRSIPPGPRNKRKNERLGIGPPDRTPASGGVMGGRPSYPVFVERLLISDRGVGRSGPGKNIAGPVQYLVTRRVVPLGRQQTTFVVPDCQVILTVWYLSGKVPYYFCPGMSLIQHGWNAP